jgi:D-ribose pyranase
VKKQGILHPELSDLIASMGHTDALVVADAGLPIPDEVWRIDLALTNGIPPFLGTVRAILGELEVQEVVVAEEMADKSPESYRQLCALLGDIPISTVPHEKFKERTCGAKGVVRTGEFTPFANVILISGVVF